MPMARNADVLIFAVGHSDGSFSLWHSSATWNVGAKSNAKPVAGHVALWSNRSPFLSVPGPGGGTGVAPHSPSGSTSRCHTRMVLNGEGDAPTRRLIEREKSSNRELQPVRLGRGSKQVQICRPFWI